MHTRPHSSCGLTLVEAALLVCVVGIVLSVGIPAFVRGLRTSKTAEAPEELERMFVAVAAYYGTPQSTPDGKRLGCLPEPAGPTPARPSPDPVEARFAAPETPGSATWRALGYAPERPIRFRYSLLPAYSGCSPPPAARRAPVTLTLRAEGDLDDDGVLSRFERKAVLRDGELVLEPLLAVHERVE